MDSSKTSKMPLLLPLLITSVLTILGWGAVSYLNAERDRDNKLRDIKLTYLIDAYRKLANASQRTSNFQHFQFDIELAISDIQLFGTTDQIEKLNIALDKLHSDNRGLQVDDILNDLRNSLREEINLSKIDGQVRWIRFNEAELDSVNKELNNTLSKPK